MPQPRCVRMCTQIQYHFFDLPFKEYRVTEDSARRSVRTRLCVGGLAENLLLGLLQLNDLTTLVSKGQFMAEPFAFANDGLSLRFAFLVELVYILHRPPVGDMACLAFPEEAVQHTAASQQTISVPSPKMGLNIASSDGNYGALPYSQHRLVRWVGCAEVAQPGWSMTAIAVSRINQGRFNVELRSSRRSTAE